MFTSTKKYLPQPLFSAYHYTLALAGNIIYLFPSRNLKLIGVTGTKGKTTTSYFLYQLLQENNLKTALVSTTFFALEKDIRPNLTKMGMPGKFFLPRFLKKARKNKLEYAVIETTSEGIAQHRGRFLDYDVVIFTGLSPEHIERHGSYEKYRLAKEKLFQQCKKIHILNLNDKKFKYFLRHPAEQKWGVSLDSIYWRRHTIPGVRFVVEGHTTEKQRMKIQEWILKRGNKKELAMQLEVTLPFLGNFNNRNFLMAFAAARSLGIDFSDLFMKVGKLKLPPGRVEELKEIGAPFRVFLDYAHEPLSLKSILETGRDLLPDGKKLICLTGAQGGGRDKWKRQAMGEIAAKYCDYIIIGTEDPYDEKPEEINQAVLDGALKNKKFKEDVNCWQFADRREAIRKALSLAKSGDIVILCGKGGEKFMCVGDKKAPWDEEKEVRKILIR